MKYGIEIKIDVTKIPKDRIFTGKKGKYISCTAFVDVDNQNEFGSNGMVVVAQTKEEREQKIKTPILGNVKVFWSGESQANLSQPQQSSQPNPQVTQVDNGMDNFNDDIPF